MRQSVKSRVLMRYILSGMAITILSCCVVGSVIVYSSTREYTSTRRQIAYARMEAALDDLITQIDMLNNIAKDISTDCQFQKRYWMEGEYYQWEMCRGLTRYKNWSSFAQEFALVYFDSDYVFQSSGFKSYRRIYAQQVLGLEPDEFDQLVSIVDGISLVPLESDRLLIIYPVRTEGYNNTSGYAALCVVIYDDVLRNRISGIGGLDDGYNLAYDDRLILGREITGESLRVTDAGFCITLDQSYLFDSPTFPYLNPMTLGIVAFIVAALTAFIGYVNYRPIKRLAGKYVTGNSEDELRALDGILTELVRSCDEDRELMKERIDNMKPLIIRSILNGELRNGVEQTLRLAELPLNGSHFATFAIYPLRDVINSERLIKLIWDLSGVDMTFFAVDDIHDNCIAVIASLAEKYLSSDAADLLRSLTAEYTGGCSVYEGRLCEQIDEISAAYKDALKNCDRSDYEVTAPNDLSEMFAAIVVGDVTLSKETLDIWMARISGNISKYYHEKSAVHDMLAELTRCAGDRGMCVDQGNLEGMICARSTVEFAEYARRQVETWCNDVSRRNQGVKANRSQDICDYIKRNYTDAELSLDKLADTFGISINTICRLIKQQVNHTFREYLITLRLEEAKARLLRSECTVAEVCKAVGYSNLSYFIRSFKEYTGMTPSEYKRTCVGQLRDAGARSRGL